MNLTPRYLIKLLEQNGYILDRSKGSHHIYVNPKSNKTISVPVHKGRDLKKGTFMGILKQAGIELK